MAHPTTYIDIDNEPVCQALDDQPRHHPRAKPCASYANDLPHPVGRYGLAQAFAPIYVRIP
jgi:hypothetical protein